MITCFVQVPFRFSEELQSFCATENIRKVKLFKDNTCKKIPELAQSSDVRKPFRQASFFDHVNAKEYDLVTKQARL
jgi:hypothetical protein